MKTLGSLVCFAWLAGCTTASPLQCSVGQLDCSAQRSDAAISGASPDRPDGALSMDARDAATPADNIQPGDSGTPPSQPATDAGQARDASAGGQPNGGSGSATAIDKVDLLFVVDNSNSMRTSQASLKAALPGFIQALTSGVQTTGVATGFPALHDLHVGVVSTDMGTPGINFANCDANGGDDGRLQHTPHGSDCQLTYPSFLSYSPSSNQDPVSFARDFACIAELGTGGCGFEQSLEAPLKALWPSVYVDRSGNVITPNPISFLSTTAMGTLGRGDVPAAQGGNLGFLRNDESDPSLIAIVLVSDEDDCSVRSTELFKPPSQLSPDSPYFKQDVNLRCFYNPDVLYDVQARYLHGLRMLRQDEHRVVFAAIAGVPADLVDGTALGKVDLHDESARNTFYDQILNDPRMQEAVDPSTLPGNGSGNLIPSCTRPDPSGQVEVSAAPPRRLVHVAQLFGEQGIVQSICEDDFTPATDAIVTLIGNQLIAKRGR